MKQLIVPPSRPQWGKDASTLPVRVTYRVKGQRQTTTRTMPHNDYIDWTFNMNANGYELVRAEQVRDA